MGFFKDLLTQSLREANRIDEMKMDSLLLFLDYRTKYEKLVGEPVLWRTFQNSNLKEPQLVIIEKPYKNFLLVKKHVYNVDGEMNTVRYAIQYNTLHCGLDTIDLLEVWTDCGT